MKLPRWPERLPRWLPYTPPSKAGRNLVAAAERKAVEEFARAMRMRRTAALFGLPMPVLKPLESPCTK